MAIVRSAGTEIIRTAMFEDIDSTEQKLIIGVQHHIYTILSMTIFCQAVQASGNIIDVSLVGWDSKEAGSADQVVIFNWPMILNETFVWNDKFSFNGYEPTGVSNILDTAIEQDAIADQEGSVAQYLKCNTSNAADNCEVTITFIDQNNA